MGLFNTYKTNKDLEVTGVVFTPDSSTAITLARSGGNNVRFAKVLEARTKPHRRQIDAGTFDPKLDRKIMINVYATTVIKNWETLVGEEGKEQLIQGIEADPDNLDAYTGKVAKHGDLYVAPFNVDNVVLTLHALPDMFQDIQRESGSMANYLATAREADAKK